VNLRIACAQHVPLQRLQAFLGLLYQRRAELQVEVEHLASAQQVERLRDGAVDLGLFHDAGPSPGVRTARLYRGEPLAVVVSLAHRLATWDIVRLADLAGDVLLVAPRSAEPGVHDRAVALSVNDGSAFGAVREAPTADVRDLLFAVASGHGVTLAPRSMLRSVGDLGEAVTARSLGPPARMPDTCLGWSANVRPELSDVYAAAHEIACELYGC
jgi:DNA-binding transcriptional LysR family regulator